MAAVTGSLIDLFADRIEERISKTFDFMLPSADPVWRDTFLSAEGVVPTDEIGKDFKILRVMHGSMAGVIEQAKPVGDWPLYGDDTDVMGQKLFVQNLSRVAPDPREGPNAKPYRLGIPMRAMVANIMFTLGEMTAESLPSTVGQVLAPKMMGLTRNWVHTICNYMYLSQNSFYQLGTIDSTYNPTFSSEVLPPGSQTVYTITLKVTNLAVHRFVVGQRLDIYSSNGETRANIVSAERARLFVQSVDYATGKIRLGSQTNPASWDVAGTDGAASNLKGQILVYANSRDGTAPKYTGIAGLNSWMKDGSDVFSATPASAPNNYLLGAECDTANAIEVSRNHPEYKIVSKAIGGALTQSVLGQVLFRHHASQSIYGGMGSQVDCLIASDGVWQNYIDQLITLIQLTPENKTSGITYHADDPDAFSIPFMGRRLKGYVSQYVEDGVMYGFQKGGGNIQRIVPPKLKGAAMGEGAEPGVPFEFYMGALTGTGSKQFPILDASGSIALPTEGYMMPMWLRMQIAMRRPGGIKMTAISTSRMWSDN